MAGIEAMLASRTLLHARKFGILAQQIKNLKLISGKSLAQQIRALQDRKINHLHRRCGSKHDTARHPQLPRQ